jgi:hypothetical protein
LEKALGDRIDVVERFDDLDARLELGFGEQSTQSGETHIGSFGSGEFVEEDKSVKPLAAGIVEVRDVEYGGDTFAVAEVDDLAVHREFAEKLAEDRPADGLDYVIVGSGALEGADYDLVGFDFGRRAQVSDRAGTAEAGELEGEVADAPGGTGYENSFADQVPALEEGVERGQARDRERAGGFVRDAGGDFGEVSQL